MRIVFILLFICNIVYAGTKEVKKMEFTFEDDVYQVNLKKDNDTEVLFKKSAARYHILKTNNHHDQIIKDLQQALAKNEKISITIDPQTQDILKVQKIKQ